MSFVEIALIISATANFFCFYMSKRTSKTIMDLSELNSAGEELLTLERRLLEHERENFERQKEFCMLQREVILNLLNAIDKENVKLDELKDLSKELKSFVLTKDTTNTTIMKLALKAFEKHK